MLLATQLKLTKVICEHFVTCHPVVSIIFNLKLYTVWISNLEVWDFRIHSRLSARMKNFYLLNLFVYNLRGEYNVIPHGWVIWIWLVSCHVCSTETLSCETGKFTSKLALLFTRVLRILTECDSTAPFTCHDLTHLVRGCNYSTLVMLFTHVLHILGTSCDLTLAFICHNSTHLDQRCKFDI